MIENFLEKETKMSTSQKTGKYILIEGIGAAGKSTQSKAVGDRLRQLGYQVVNIREPGSSKICESIREILIDKGYKELMSAKTSLFLFCAARHQLITEMVKPLLAQGISVITDRSYLSTIAIQGYAEGLDLDLVRNCCQIAMDDLTFDKGFILDISVDEGIARIKKRGLAQADRYDIMSRDFIERIRQGYLAQAHDKNFELINGSRPEDIITAELIQKILPLF